MQANESIPSSNKYMKSPTDYLGIKQEPSTDDESQSQSSSKVCIIVYFFPQELTDPFCVSQLMFFK